MNLLSSDPLDRLRNPEHTGENRCIPCTFVNTLLALGIGILSSLLWLPLGIAVLILSVGVIAIRGYLVPWTPTLTQRYFPKIVLRRFGKDPTESSSHRRGLDFDELEVLLERNDIIKECFDIDDVCLTDSFADDWWNRIEDLRSEVNATNELAAVLEVSPTDLDLEEGDNRFMVRHQGDDIGSWRSHAAFLADLAVTPLLEERLPNWNRFNERERSQLISMMRVFLESCPTCDGSVSAEESVKSSCCRGEIIEAAIICEECGDEVFNGSVR